MKVGDTMPVSGAWFLPACGAAVILDGTRASRVHVPGFRRVRRASAAAVRASGIPAVCRFDRHRDCDTGLVTREGDPLGRVTRGGPPDRVSPS